MVTLSKKDARKAKVGKGKAKEEVSKPKPSKKIVEEELEDEDDDSSEDEDDYGVSEEGIKRLMELVDPEDLDEFEKALLGGDDEDEEGEEEDGEDEGEDEELVSGEEALSDEDSDEEDDEEEDEEDLDNTIVNEKPDEDAISLDGLQSDVSVDEDAVPMRKVTINNKPAMRTITEAIKVTSMPWPEHLVLNSKEIVEVDPSDDLQREMAFYKIALECVPQAKKLAAKHDIPFTRPTDYYAEMVKSDEHMERVRTKLVEEAQGIKKSEAAKKQRDLKKFGKQIQHEKLKQREMDKKSFQDRVQGLKRKRKEGMELGEDGDDDQFGISVEDAIEGKPERGSGGGRGRGGKAKMPRHVRDNKYSLGGSSRRDKQNTRDSTNDFSFGGGKPGRGGKGGRGGRGGGGRGGGGRPGKSRRMAGRV